MKWRLTGPLNGSADRFKDYEGYNFVILGDSGFYRSENRKLLKNVKKMKNVFYCVRGSMDSDPAFTTGFVSSFDNDVQGVVSYKLDCPNVRYFTDGQIYSINGKNILVIGGGVSLEERKLLLGNKTCYFNTVISEERRKVISDYVSGKEVDFIFTYTAPYSWVAPSSHNTEMEKWLDEIKNMLKWKKWYFGRYREDVDISENIKEVYEDILQIGDGND